MGYYHNFLLRIQPRKSLRGQISINVSNLNFVVFYLVKFQKNFQISIFLAKIRGQCGHFAAERIFYTP